MGKPVTDETTRSFRVPDALWAQAGEAADRAGVSVSEWIREQMARGVAARTGGVDPVSDRAYGDALDRLVIRWMERDHAAAIRKAVVTCRALLDECGIDPVALLDAKRAATAGPPRPRPVKG